MSHKVKIVKNGSLSKHWRLVGALLVVICLWVTYNFWSSTQSSNLQLATLKFDTTITNQVALFKKQFETYADTLYAGRALYAVNNNITQDNWTQFYTTQSISSRYPGINSIGYIQVLSTQQADSSTPATKIITTPLTSTVAVVSYIEPFQENKQIVGYDLFSDSARVKMLTRAANTGLVRASTPLQLAVNKTETSGKPAIIFVLPVYRVTDMTLDTVAKRQAALEGYVGLSVYIQPMLDNLMTTLSTDRDISLTVSSNSTTVYQTHNSQAANYIQKIDTVDVAGQPWTFMFRAPSDYGLDFASKTAPVIALIRGFIVALLILGLLLYSAGVRFVSHPNHTSL